MKNLEPLASVIGIFVVVIGGGLAVLTLAILVWSPLMPLLTAPGALWIVFALTVAFIALSLVWERTHKK